MKKVDNFDSSKWLIENKITTQSRLNENRFMSGMKFIEEKTPEIINIINQLKTDYPEHKFNLRSNSDWKPDRPDLDGTYTFSYSGPEDDELKEKVENLKNNLNEFGPMYGSQNKTQNNPNPLVKTISNLDRILNDITKTPFKASMEWEAKSEEILGENNYWGQLDDTELEEAINIAKNILSKYNIYYNKKNI
jgi:hypothetical protein